MTDERIERAFRKYDSGKDMVLTGRSGSVVVTRILWGPVSSERYNTELRDAQRQAEQLDLRVTVAPLKKRVYLEEPLIIDIDGSFNWGKNYDE